MSTATGPRWRGHPLAHADAEHRRPSRDWSGWCLVFTQECYGVPPRDPSAAAAWRLARRKHRTGDPDEIPRRAPVFWLGGRRGFGHVAVSAGGGWCWSTDLRRPGKVDKVRIAEIGARWGLQLVGWTEDLQGVTVYTSPAPAPATTAHQRRAAGNRVTAARELLADARELLAATPPGRRVAHAGADRLAELLAWLPRR